MEPQVHAALLQHANNFGQELTGFVLHAQPGWLRKERPNGRWDPKLSKGPRAKKGWSPEYPWRRRGLNNVSPDAVGSYFWKKLLRRAGVVDEGGKNKYRFHDLRHFFVALMIDKGLDPYRISKLVGHANIQTTMNTYGHLFPSDDTARVAITAAASQFIVPAMPVATKPQLLRDEREPDRERMRQLRAEGMPAAEIAKLLNVSPYMVSYWTSPRTRDLRLTRARKPVASEIDAAQVQHGPAKFLN